MVLTPPPLFPIARNTKQQADFARPSDLREQLKRFDSDNDTRLSYRDLQTALESNGSMCNMVSTFRATKASNKNADEGINISDQEMKELLKYSLQMGYKITY